MSTVLIPYGTTEGQTAKIAEVIAEVLREQGHEADPVEVRPLHDTLPEGHDAVIIGASIHMGKHDKHVVEYVQKNLDTISRLPSAFFSVSLAAYGDTEEAEGYVEQFEQETGWHPDKVTLFGGALLYTEYGFFKRHLMKRIAADKPGHLGLDLSRDYIYTEWDAVKRFAEHFAHQMRPSPSERLDRRGTLPPAGSPAVRRQDRRRGAEPSAHHRPGPTGTASSHVAKRDPHP